MSSDPQIPETHVLAIASHVTYGYVGNTMATFVLQSLGYEVSAINTVNYSNHKAYRTFKGRDTPASEISDFYTGLKQLCLNEFDMLLSGYIPSAAAVHAVGTIARDLKLQYTTKPGSFFWGGFVQSRIYSAPSLTVGCVVLDPVMGDDGRLYVNSDVVPAYKGLLMDADLVLPNQYEAEILSGVKIEGLEGVVRAVEVLHRTFRVPHVVATSLRLGGAETEMLTIVGSSARKDGSPRLFRIDFPRLPIFFSGTGDMFAALMVVRFREASAAAGLLTTKSWQCPDDVAATDLPLARAAEKTLSSMQSILRKTQAAYETELASLSDALVPLEEDEEGDKRMHVRLTKAAEVRVLRNVRDLREPEEGMFRAKGVL